MSLSRSSSSSVIELFGQGEREAGAEVVVMRRAALLRLCRRGEQQGCGERKETAGVPGERAFAGCAGREKRLSEETKEIHFLWIYWI